MMLRKILVLPAVLLFAASTLSAFQAKPADLTGTWTGSLVPETGNPSTAHFALKQKGAELSGTAGPDAERQVDIAKGKVSTVKNVTSVNFEATQPNGILLTFDLKLVEGRLKGSVHMVRPDGEKRDATVDVGRAK